MTIGSGIGQSIGSGIGSGISGGGNGGQSTSLAGVAGIQFDIDVIDSPYADPLVTSLVNPSNYVFDETISVTDLDKEAGGTYWDVNATTDGIGFSSVQSGGTPAFLTDFHKANNGQSVWAAVGLQSPSTWAAGENIFMGNQNDNPARIGWNMFYNNSGNGTLGIQLMDGTSVTTLSVTASLATSTNYLILMLLEHSSGTTTLTVYVNSVVNIGTDSAAFTSTADDDGLMTLGNDDSSTQTSIGTRYYWWGMGNAAPSTSDIRAIADALEARHGRTYFAAPENITGIQWTWPAPGPGFVGGEEVEIYDAARQDVSQTLVTSLFDADGQGATGFGDIGDGELGVDALFGTSDANNINNGSDAVAWFSASSSSGLELYMGFNATLDRLTSVIYRFDTNQPNINPTFRDRSGTSIPIAWTVTRSPGVREYIF